MSRFLHFLSTVDCNHVLLTDDWITCLLSPVLTVKEAKLKDCDFFGRCFTSWKWKYARSLLASLSSTLHIIMLDCPLIFRIKTSKTAFPWLKGTYKTLGCLQQGTKKTLEELTLSSSSIHVRTSLQQKRKHSWLSRGVGSCKKKTELWPGIRRVKN